ncbi:class I SAM-dependent methyltransferase [Actinoplanes xinjiangensis]|uniref:class I SAM-dependent methyltransferase n=1 Tax=Actinoplanes xinjiangensis TaxID=512350 RepID=UPI00343E8234
MWESGTAYEAYVGRWSRHVAADFVAWLDPPPGLTWLDAGAGTGALTSAITAGAAPLRVACVDRSPGFLTAARTTAAGPARVCAGDATALPLRSRTFAAVVSGLTLNFVERPEVAVREFARVVTPGGAVAAYVWDYAGGMSMLREFWAAATELDPAAATLDEGLRFGFCRDDVLAAWWTGAGLRDVTTRRIEIATAFSDFDDYWRPFLGGQGPAPAYLATRTETQRTALRELLRTRLPAGPDGSITLTAAAWAVRGRG